MKKLSIEEKARRYDEAIRIAKENYETAQNFCEGSQIGVECFKNTLTNIFPELKESEDERIRKELIFYLGDMPEDTELRNGVTNRDVLDWLEKQGKKKLEYTLGDVFDDLRAGLDPSPTQNEQKSVVKVEPKFKVGQWIVWKDKYYKVNYNGCGYELVDQNGLSTSLEYGTIDENAHIWNITKDAKDGDILASDNSVFIFQEEYIIENPIAYCCITDGCFYRGINDCWTKEQCYPATKEQRDFLFQKMKEVGYEWDIKNKHLIKI